MVDRSTGNALRRTGFTKFLRWSDPWLVALAGAGVSAFALRVLFQLSWVSATILATVILLLLFATAGSLYWRRRGVFLSLAKRVVCLMVISGTFAATLVVAIVPTTETSVLSGLNQTEEDLQVRISRLLEVDRRANKLIRSYQATIDSLIREIAILKEAGDERAEELITNHAEKIAVLEEKNRELVKVRGRDAEGHQTQVTPAPAPSENPEPPNGGYYDGELVIPEEREEVLKLTPRGRSLLEEFPIVGPVIGSLLGGGTRYSTQRMIQTIAEEGRIPSKKDIRDVFANAEDLQALRSEFDALIRRGIEKGVIDRNLADEIRVAMDQTIQELHDALPEDVKAALTNLRAALNAGQKCSVEVTAPDFTEFPSKTEKAITVARAEGADLKACLQTFPP